MIHQRLDSSTDFTLFFTSYQNGFGNPLTNFWKGLEPVYQLTSTAQYKLRIETLAAGSSTWLFVEYATFSLDSATGKYAMHTTGYSGTLPNLMNGPKSNWLHNGMKFTTRDNDNDMWPGGSCSTGNTNEGWWFNFCQFFCLTGSYNTNQYAYNDYNSATNTEHWIHISQSRMMISLL